MAAAKGKKKTKAAVVESAPAGDSAAEDASEQAVEFMADCYGTEKKVKIIHAPKAAPKPKSPKKGKKKGSKKVKRAGKGKKK